MDEDFSFEQALARLEEITGQLQKGGMSIEEMIALFEEGTVLAKICHERLDAAELKLSRLQIQQDEHDRSGDSDE